MSDTEVVASDPPTNGQKRGRGRPKKDPNAPKKIKVWNNGVTDGTNGTNGQEVSTSNKRGRKPRADSPAKVEKPSPSTGAKRGRGRPKKGAKKGAVGGKKRGRKPKKVSSEEESAGEESAPNDSVDEEVGQEDDE